MNNLRHTLSTHIIYLGIVSESSLNSLSDDTNQTGQIQYVSHSQYFAPRPSFVSPGHETMSFFIFVYISIPLHVPVTNRGAIGGG